MPDKEDAFLDVGDGVDIDPGTCGPFDECRMTLRSILSLNCVDYIVAFFSATYLCIVAIDMMADDALTQHVVGSNATCAIDTASQIRQGIVLRIDLAFLIFFATEGCVRLFAFGPSHYCSRKLNVIDAVVVIIGLIIDVLLLQGMIEASFSLLRLGRATRLVRIAVLYQRFQARKASLSAKRKLAIAHVRQIATCDWTTCKRRPPPPRACSSASMRTTDSTRDSVMGMAKRRFNANGGEGSATKYCAFISHQKSEGATIARFLHDSFQVICEADAFLDSADLFDLRDLMTHLQQSEAVVFVATRSALQSVWVLMELFVAVEKGIPIVPVFDSAFDAMAGQAYLSNLESQLGQINTKALGTLRTKVQESGFEGTINDFAQVVSKAIFGQPEDQTVFFPNGSDEVLNAMCTTLVNRLADVTFRNLKWTVDAHSDSSSFAGADGKLKSDFLANCLPWRNRGDKTKPRFKYFIACNQTDEMPQLARRVASHMQLKLQTAVKGPVIMESASDLDKRVGELVDDARSLATEIENFSSCIIDQGLLCSEVVVVLLTANVLHRPWTLVQLYEAIRAGIPIVSVLIDGGGYDFAHADTLLSDLSIGLEKATGDASAYNILRQLCQERGLSPRRLQRVLGTALASLLAINYRPGGDMAYTDAVIRDIVQRTRHTPNSSVHATSTANSSPGNAFGERSQEGESLSERSGFLRSELKHSFETIIAARRLGDSGRSLTAKLELATAAELGLDPAEVEHMSDLQKREAVKTTRTIDAMNVLRMRRRKAEKDPKGGAAALRRKVQMVRSVSSVRQRANLSEQATAGASEVVLTVETPQSDANGAVSAAVEDPEVVASEAAIDDNVRLGVEDDEEPPPMLGLQPASISMRILSELEAETAAEADMAI